MTGSNPAESTRAGPAGGPARRPAPGAAPGRQTRRQRINRLISGISARSSGGRCDRCAICGLPWRISTGCSRSGARLREACADIVVAGVKEDDFQLGLVLGDPPGRSPGRPVMLDDKHFEGRCCVRTSPSGGARLSISPMGRCRNRSMTNDAFLDCRRQLRSHTRQYRGGSEQAKNLAGRLGCMGAVRASGRSRLPETGLQDKIGMAVRKA